MPFGGRDAGGAAFTTVYILLATDGVLTALLCPTADPRGQQRQPLLAESRASDAQDARGKATWLGVVHVQLGRVRVGE